MALRTILLIYNTDVLLVLNKLHTFLLSILSPIIRAIINQVTDKYALQCLLVSVNYPIDKQ